MLLRCLTVGLADSIVEKIETLSFYLLRLVDLDGIAQTLTSNYTSYILYSQFVPQPGGNPRFFTPREVTLNNTLL